MLSPYIPGLVTVGPPSQIWFHLRMACSEMLQRVRSYRSLNKSRGDILATGQSGIHCKIKETLLIRDLKPALNENVDSEKLFSSLMAIYIFLADLTRSVYFHLLFSLPLLSLFGISLRV